MESERQFRELQVCYNFKVSNYELRFNGSFSQTYSRHIVAKLEDYRERDKIRDAELALMKEKLTIVISSFEAEKAKIVAEYTLKFHENKTRLAEQEYALASLQTSYDESQRARLSNEETKNEIQDDLMVTMRENEILKANNEELQESIAELYEDTKILRKTLQSAYNTMEMAYNSRVRGRTSNMTQTQNSNFNQNLNADDKVSREILDTLRKEIAQKNEKIFKMTQSLREKEGEIVVLKAENVSLSRGEKTDLVTKEKPPDVGNSLTTSTLYERDSGQNDMILKTKTPGLLKRNASDTETFTRKSSCQRMKSEPQGKKLTKIRQVETLVERKVNKLKKRRRLLNQSTIEDTAVTRD